MREACTKKIMSAAGSGGSDVELFFKMLADVMDRHPSGLPDTELQLVFERHQVALNGPEFLPQECLADHQASDIRKSGGSRQPLLRLVSDSHS